MSAKDPSPTQLEEEEAADPLAPSARPMVAASRQVRFVAHFVPPMVIAKLLGGAKECTVTSDERLLVFGDRGAGRREGARGSLLCSYKLHGLPLAHCIEVTVEWRVAPQASAPEEAFLRVPPQPHGTLIGEDPWRPLHASSSSPEERDCSSNGGTIFGAMTAAEKHQGSVNDETGVKPLKPVASTPGSLEELQRQHAQASNGTPGEMDHASRARHGLEGVPGEQGPPRHREEEDEGEEEEEEEGEEEVGTGDWVLETQCY